MLRHVGLGQLRLNARSAYMHVSLWPQGRAYKRSQLYINLLLTYLPDVSVLCILLISINFGLFCKKT